ncbi:MAG TPA: hypothetical protein VKW76_04935 [Candidatus Binatia bacterium]|nr:hypothetical protein [Candidatus Binatia bacterium]
MLGLRDEGRSARARVRGDGAREVALRHDGPAADCGEPAEVALDRPEARRAVRHDDVQPGVGTQQAV